MQMWNDKLKKLRKEQKLSQQEFAQKIGIPQPRYSNYETGTSEPNIETLLKIANYYKVSIDYILDRYTEETT